MTRPRELRGPGKMYRGLLRRLLRSTAAHITVATTAAATTTTTTTFAGTFVEFLAATATATASASWMWRWRGSSRPTAQTQGHPMIGS
jgi:hypothetical protein